MIVQEIEPALEPITDLDWARISARGPHWPRARYKRRSKEWRTFARSGDDAVIMGAYVVDGMVVKMKLPLSDFPNDLASLDDLECAIGFRIKVASV